MGSKKLFRQMFNGGFPQPRGLRTVRPHIMRKAKRDFIRFVAAVVAVGLVVELLAAAGIDIKLKDLSFHVHGNLPLRSSNSPKRVESNSVIFERALADQMQ